VRLDLPSLTESPLPGVRVAWADLDAGHWIEAALEPSLSAAERERSRRFRFEADRRRFVVAHAVLRSLLGDQLGLEPVRVQLVSDALGKPRLGGQASSGLEFNMSHCGARALYAVARDAELGVDAEALRPLADIAQLARDAFSADELAEWDALPETLRLPGFFNGWTRKEAVVKALGRGLDFPLGAFSVSLAPGRPAELRRAPAGAGPHADWSIAAFSPETGYVAAVVALRRGAGPAGP